ncbi:MULTISPECIES: NAD(P)H-quinone oxidoreductase [Thermaerobacter]|uniref:NAD(P)H-quinone oxidoreductase n=1 Tax=Thermaerobacter composti TaxID=554949 RepID=A0ABZ0QLW1_9FIRM|nr:MULTISPECIES: NAD(P)H-quinone oxidoreductase [Thermaerobacter]PZN06853.1 MAG: NADPH:quinone oxidoreductase [Bacillota bacterium]QBS38185.1 NAD(P)H-quinone oxidoreductase [Thermaerobacter sp. FW80]WPD18229.1 NAD(P)H-quinone oxidoreductase [Thermaerobacter composti]
MKAVLVRQPGGAENLVLGEVPTPAPGPGELLVRVRATALNRADILQRRGLYPPPPGASPLLGLEAAGEVAALGEGCEGWRVGDRVFALLPGGGYAQYVTVPAAMALPVPPNLSFEEAAAIPEAFLTAYQTLFWIGRLRAGEWVLIHAGASGVGTAAIQLARDAGARVAVTAGSEAKLEACRQLGAEVALNYKLGPFAPALREAVGERGVDLILDFVGAPYWEQNLECLATDGRLVLIATMGGGVVDRFDLRRLMGKRLQVTGTTLRSRSLEYKVQLTREFAVRVLPKLARGAIRPVIDRVFPWDQVREAHRYMERNLNIGKIVLRVD